MPSVFSSKELLDKKYKRLFLNRLYIATKFKNYLSARFKIIITEKQLKELFLNQPSKISEFLAQKNEESPIRFFGDSEHSHPRDAQIRLIDRLVLDSVHAEITAIILTQFIKEYYQNQDAIDKEWSDEIQSDSAGDSTSNMAIILKAITLYKDRVFQDLVFSDGDCISLFDFDGRCINPNRTVFKNWLPKPGKKLFFEWEPVAYLSAVTVFSCLIATIMYWPSLLLGPIGWSVALPLLLTAAAVAAVGLTTFLICRIIIGNKEQANSKEHVTSSSTEMILDNLPSSSVAPKTEPQALPPTAGYKGLFVPISHNVDEENTPTQSNSLT
ncbi:hypothetical protein [Legionella worsleiensis]|uniref:Uncharacterized protein n=1 Tax=Legionella worsleiensis TaxID=45076 RepID=A0A0W1A6F3_9GAMM|nr:hypothetical protein [Legionella worsleiensis]KTD76906.1 hypothetical protein Lwor_2131 [Legionella worsleiensis]STY33424.1 Uncharacterised protein [Legionella worsleiensis]